MFYRKFPFPIRSKLRTIRRESSGYIGALIWLVAPEFSRNTMAQRVITRQGGRINRLLTYFIVNRILARYYRRGTSLERREQLKSLWMSGEGGVAWARHYASHAFPDEHTHFRIGYQWIEELLAGGEVRSLHQLGVSSGREVAYFAKRHSQVTCVGSDFDPAIVDACRDCWADVPNLTFKTIDITNLDKDGAPREDVIFVSGSLQYVDQNSLTNFFEVVRRTAKWIVLCEPVEWDFDIVHEERS